VSSLRTTMRIERISDWIRTHHWRDRSRGNRMGRNWNRWHGSVAHIIDTAGKQPREQAVKFTGRRKVHHYHTSVFLGLVRGAGTPHSCCSRTNRKQRGKRYLKPTPTPRSCEINFRVGPTEFWRTTMVSQRVGRDQSDSPVLLSLGRPRNLGVEASRLGVSRYRFLV